MDFRLFQRIVRLSKMENIERAKVLEIAKSYLKTKYHHMGRVKQGGVDCLTLLACVFEEAELVPKIEIPYYPQDWHLHRSEERYLKGLLNFTIEVKTPKPADIVLWKFGRCYSHGAIVVEWPLVIHAYTGIGCVYEDAEASLFLKTVAERVSENGNPRPHKFFSFWNK